MKEVLIALNQQPIAVYPIYIDITGSMTAGVLLSQVMYWDSKMKGNEFYKNDAEFMQETRLTQSEFKTAKKIIGDLPFITIQRKGVPCRTWYSVNHSSLLVVLQQFSSSFTYELGSRLSTSQRGVNLRTIIGTENTTEITTENTLVESYNSTVVVHDQVDEVGLQVHDVIDDNAALLPQLDVDEEKKKGSGAKRKERAAKNPDPTPINAMWDILLEQSAKIGNDEPQFMPRYGRDFKLLYAILKQRAEKRQEPITDQVEPFRRYVTKIVDYIIKGRKVPQHQFTANNLARNFNPGYLHTSFNQICATIQSGVTVTNQPNRPTEYNESEVYRNFDSSQAAF